MKLLDCFLSILLIILIFIVSLGVVPFILDIVFPFFKGFSSEKRMEKYSNEHCIKGNDIAILIRRDKLNYYLERDYDLIRAAIEGNENAIKALKLDREKK